MLIYYLTEYNTLYITRRLAIFIKKKRNLLKFLKPLFLQRTLNSLPWPCFINTPYLSFWGRQRATPKVRISGIICFYGFQILQISHFYVTLPWDTIDPLIGVPFIHTPKRWDLLKYLYKISGAFLTPHPFVVSDIHIWCKMNICGPTCVKCAYIIILNHGNVMCSVYILNLHINLSRFVIS